MHDHLARRLAELDIWCSGMILMARFRVPHRLAGSPVKLWLLVARTTPILMQVDFWTVPVQIAERRYPKQRLIAVDDCPPLHVCPKEIVQIEGMTPREFGRRYRLDQRGHDIPMPRRKTYETDGIADTLRQETMLRLIRAIRFIHS